MTGNEYQQLALRTAVKDPVPGHPIIYPALGLADEAGEVLGKIKKLYRDNDGVPTEDFRAMIKKELGDVAWYLAVLSHKFGLTFDDVLESNIAKLSDRAERGVLKGSGDNR